MQVGWVDREGYAQPKYYTEFKGAGTYYDPVHEFAATAGTHTYKCEYISVDQNWPCAVDSTWLRSAALAQMGWSSGSYLVVQGEANAVHAQIGTLLPSHLDFTSMQYKKTTTWLTFDITSMSNPGFPYERGEPAAGRFWNATNSNH